MYKIQYRQEGVELHLNMTEFVMIRAILEVCEVSNNIRIAEMLETLIIKFQEIPPEFNENYNFVIDEENFMLDGFIKITQV